MRIARSRFPVVRSKRRTGNGKHAAQIFSFDRVNSRGYKKICAMIGPSWFFENTGGIGSPFPFFWGAQKKKVFRKISVCSWRAQRTK
jgi:hypothetical protein